MFSPEFFRRMTLMAMIPLVIVGEKVSSESMDAFSSLYRLLMSVLQSKT